MLTGSCLCGDVGWQIDGELDELHHCHCSRCRKSHGAAFSTFGRVDRAAFRFTRGESQVRGYRSSPQVERSFCGRCGSNLLFAFDPFPQFLWVAAGSIDGDPGLRPGGHIFWKSKADWFELVDALPKHDEYPSEE